MSATSRTCCRCARSFSGKAGRMVGGRPACQSCGNATRQPVACVACSCPTKRPARSADAGGLICERCARRRTHATCRTCRRHRRVARRDGDGRALCKACGADEPVTHACPDCGLPGPGSGAAPCMRCSLARRIARTVAAEAALLGQAWTRDLFTAFCGWDGLRRERGDMPRHIRRYAAFFAVIDRNCASAAEVTQARLVELHGAEGLRRGFQAVAFLAGHLQLDWNVDAVAAATERGRVDTTIAAAGTEPWGRDLQAYRAHLAVSRKLTPVTTRMYVAAAAAMLGASGVRQASELTQRHLARHLRRSRGRRNNLLSFLSWVAATSVQRFDPGPARRTSPKKREKATLRKAAVLLDRLGAAGSRREHQALLAAAVGVLHGMPLSEVLALRRGDTPGIDQRAAVALGRVVEAVDPLIGGINKAEAKASAFAFYGRSGLQPLSASAVRHHVRSHPGAR